MKLINVENLKDSLNHEYTSRFLDTNKLPYKDRKGYRLCMNDVQTVIVNMQEHKAKWVLGIWTYENEDYYALKCSKCGHQVLCTPKIQGRTEGWAYDYLLQASKENKYCRNCGSRMENVEEKQNAKPD